MKTHSRKISVWHFKYPQTRAKVISVGGSTRRGGAVVGKGGWRVGAPVGSVGWRSSVGGLTCEGKRAWGRARQRRGGAPDLNKKHADCDGSGSGLGSVGGLITQ